MNKVKTSFLKGIISVFLSLTLSVGAVVPAHAYSAAFEGAAFVVNIAGIIVGLLNLADDNTTNANNAKADLNKYWRSEPNWSSRCEASADDLWQAAFELNSSGVPCEVYYQNALGYYIRGTGSVNLPTPSHAGIIQIIGDEFVTLNKVLCTLDGRPIVSYTEPSPKLLDSINDWLSSISNHLSRIEGYIDGIEGYIDGVETYLNTLSSYLFDISGHSVSIDNKLSSLSSFETRLISLDGNVQTIADLIPTKQYMSAYTTNSSGTSFSVVTLPYDVATAYCGYLNAMFVGKTLNQFNRDDLNVGANPIFNYATIQSNYIRINYGSNSMGYAASRRKVIYKVASPNTINVSGDVNATLDDTNIVNALNDIEDTLSNLNVSSSDLINQYYVVNTSFSDTTAYPTVTIPYESAVNLVGILNAELQGKKINRLDRDTNTVTSTFDFNVARMSNGNIVVIVGSNTSGGYFLCSRNHILIKYAAPTYEQVLNSIESALYGQTQTRSTVPVPIGETSLATYNAVNSLGALTGTIVTDMATLIAPEVGIIALVGDILNAITNGVGDDAIINKLNEIKGKIDITNDKLQAIYDYIDNNDLVDSQTIQTLLTNWSGDVVTTFANSNRILGLFDSAFGDSATPFASTDWSIASSYLANFFNT